MIHTILVALDPDTDTPVATQYARSIAERYDAEVTGVAVVDMGSIESSSRGGGVGSMYLMEELQKNLTAEARAVAQDLIRTFEDTMRGGEVTFGTQVEEGVPFERIIEDMKYHDMLVVGSEPHFFYSHPEQKTKTLSRIIERTVAPVFVVRETFRPIRRVMVAYDGSDPAVRTLQWFAQMAPFGKDISVDVVHIYEKGKGSEANLMLRLVKEYLGKHGFEAKATSLAGSDPTKDILEHCAQSQADAVVMGAHATSKLERWIFGSTTATILSDAPVPVFIHH